MNSINSRKPRLLRGLAVTAAAATALALAACSTAGSPNSQGSGSASSAPDAKSITAVFLSGGAYDPCSDEYAADFQKKYGTKVNVIHEGYPTLHDKLLTALSSGGSTYDVMMIAYQWTGEFSPFLTPLTKQVKANKALSGVIGSATNSYVSDGQQYAVPFSAQAETLYYRTDLFKKAGLKAPTTWDQWEKDIKFFSNNPDFPGVYGTSVKASASNSESEFNTRYYGLGGKPLVGAKSKISPSVASKALQLLKSDVAKSPAGALNATFAETGAQFQSGSVAMGEFQPTTVNSLITANTAQNKVLGKVAATVMPGGHGEMGGWGLAVPKSSPNQATSIKFAQYLSTAEIDHACFVKDGKSPVQTASYTASDVTSLFYANGIRQSLASSLPRPSGKTGGSINTMMTNVIDQYLAGQIKDADTAAKQMADQYSKLNK
jgi:multiple sugar transport system substrate-binding protein